MLLESEINQSTRIAPSRGCSKKCACNSNRSADASEYYYADHNNQDG
jgi:hypothetical protein